MDDFIVSYLRLLKGTLRELDMMDDDTYMKNRNFSYGIDVLVHKLLTEGT
jgi:hypothetical protein